MSLLDDLKKNREKSLTQLASYEDASKPKKAETQQDDGRFWQLVSDKAGNGFAVIRFLPRTSMETFPFVQEIKHNFNNPTNKRFVNEICPTLFKKPCPICESNAVLWKAGDEATVRGLNGKNGRKRIVKYVSNILVINDPANPENNGKVKLFRYGSQIFNKCFALAKPEEGSGDTPIDVFCPWKGANLKIKVVKLSGFPNYNDSLFSVPAPIGSDEEIESILNQMTDLSTIISEKNLKSYDELKKRLDFVIGASVSVPEEEVEEDEDLAEQTGFVSQSSSLNVDRGTEEVSAAPVRTPPPTVERKSESDQEVDDYFANLVPKD